MQIPSNTHVYVSRSMCISFFVSITAGICSCKSSRIRIYVYANVDAAARRRGCMCLYLQAVICMYTCAYSRVCIYVHIYMYPYAYLCTSAVAYINPDPRIPTLTEHLARFRGRAPKTETPFLIKRDYLESLVGYFQLIVSYFRVYWPLIFCYLAIQVHVSRAWKLKVRLQIKVLRALAAWIVTPEPCPTFGVAGGDSSSDRSESCQANRHSRA